MNVCQQDGSEHRFGVDLYAPIGHLMSELCAKTGVAQQSVRFLFDGTRINEHQTPSDMDVWPFDVIDVMIEQRGC
jgi:small ubiquitin-related modifier